MNATPRVFISRSPQDDAFALRLAQDLIQQGIDVWVAPQPEGVTPVEQLSAALQHCDWFVVVQTPEALQSSLVRAEARLALAAVREGQLRGAIALQIAPTSLEPEPPTWHAFHILNAVDHPYADVVAQLAKVLWGNITLPGAPISERATQLVRQPQRGITRRRLLLSAGFVGTMLATAGITIFAGRLIRPTKRIIYVTATPLPATGPGSRILTYRGHSSRVYGVAWSPDGMRIASGGGGDMNGDTTVQIWNALDGSHALIYYGHDMAIREIAWAHHSRRIASVSEDFTAQIWDPNTLDLLEDYHGHSKDVDCVAWSPAEQLIATGSLDTTVKIWDSRTKETVLSYTGHTMRVNGVAWSPDGKTIASCGFDNTAQVWNPTTGALILTYTRHTSLVLRVRWSPDGRYLATSSADGTVRVWDPATGTDVRVYTEHTGEVYPIAWSPDGQYIASGGEDHTVRVWHALTGTTMLVYRQHAGWVNEISWSPDGTRIASGSDDHTVQVWRVR